MSDSNSTLKKYIARKKLMATDLARSAKRNSICYLFLLPSLKLLILQLSLCFVSSLSLLLSC